MLLFLKNIKQSYNTIHSEQISGMRDLLRSLGPGLLVTVGFIDPGNWASNFLAGSQYGYLLLWVVTLSTIMLIILQHNVAHLGIVTGLCLSEATTSYFSKKASRFVLWSAVGASVSTSLAEILGGAIALQILFHIPIKIGAILVTIFVAILIFTSSYKKIERYIVAFVSLIGLSFIYELFLIHVDWGIAVKSTFSPTIPNGSMLVIMSVIGSVVMPHNLFLHSEVIQSRKWNLKGQTTIKKRLKFEFFDTIVSMIIGWAINAAMILLAAATFFKRGVVVSDLYQAKDLLEPLLGSNAAIVFGVALLFAGLSSTITSGMAAGSIFAGMYNEPYNIKDIHSRIGVGISLGFALLVIFMIRNAFMGLIISQALLSLQLPITIFAQINLTSSQKVMGRYANRKFSKCLLYLVAFLITVLNIYLIITLCFHS